MKHFLEPGATAAGGRTARSLLFACFLITIGRSAELPSGGLGGPDAKTFAGQRTWPVPILDNAGNAPTPPMGYSLWNSFGDNPGPSDLLVRELADALVSTGLKDAGYVYLLAFDGGWWTAAVTPGRDSAGRIQIDRRRWPNGIQAVSDYIHQKGLKVGGYTDIGESGYSLPIEWGMRDHEAQDASQFAAWNFDYIKIDDHGPGNFYTVCEAISNHAFRRNIVISLSTPLTFPFRFGPRMANLWRVGGDITVNLGHGAWNDILREFDIAGAFWWAQAPGRWNDLDMLVLGLFGISDEEAKSEFNMWAIRGAPLLIGADIRPPYMGATGPIPKIDVRQLEILKNAEVIAIDQDRLGASGRPVRAANLAGGEVDVKPLGSFTSGEYAVLLLNRSETVQDIRIAWTDLPLRTGGATVRDVWTHQDLGAMPDGYLAKAVPAHGSVMLRVKGTFDWSLPREYEAESSYNRLSGLAQVQILDEGAANATWLANAGAGHPPCPAAISGIGNGPDNTLQFNGVAAPADGLYVMKICYASASQGDAYLEVNGQRIHLVFASTGGASRFGWQSCQIALRAGNNAIRISNPTAWAPGIDKIRIEQK